MSKQMEGSSNKKPVAVIVGAGPGLGFSAAKRFASEGYEVMLMARNEEKVMAAAKAITLEGGASAAGISVDCTDLTSVKKAFESASTLGPIEVMVYNVNSRFPWPPPKFTDISPENFENSIKAGVLGAFYCAQQVLPSMEAYGRGTLIFTGATASVRGSAGFSELACGKFALRGLAQCLAREYGPKGIHVAHVIIDGMIKSARSGPGPQENSRLDPDAIASAYWQLHKQHPSAWSQEIDLRPFCEKF